jgi:NRE family putative nickel resistance protein-like MFS transporter
MVDRYDRKTVMILMDIIRMGLVGVLPLLSHAPLGVILGVAFCVSTATVLFNPARAAALPDLVPYTLLSGANSALAVAERGTEIAGFSAAAAIIAFGGVPLVFTIDAITFALSAIIVLTITFPAMVGSSRPETGRSNRREILDGLKQIFGSSELRSIFSFSFLMVAAGSALAPLTVPLAIEHLHAGNSGYAICLAAIAVGATVGALLTGMLHTPRRGMLMVGGAMGMGGATIMAGLSPVLPLTVAFLAVGGVANMVYLIPMLTSIQELTETHIRGRVMAARFTMVQIGLLVGALYATVTTSSLLPQASAGVAVVGSGLLMVAVASWAGAFGSIRRL